MSDAPAPPPPTPTPPPPPAPAPGDAWLDKVGGRWSPLRGGLLAAALAAGVGQAAAVLAGGPAWLVLAFGGVVLATVVWLAAAPSQRRAVRLLRAIVRQTGEGVLVADADERMVFANAAARGTFGPGAQDVVDLPNEQRRYLADAGGRTLTIDELPLLRAARGETIAGGEYRLKLGDGPERRLSVNAGPLVGDDGRPLGGLATFRDVTDEALARAALERQVAFSELVLEEIGDAVFVVRADGGPPIINRAGRTILGLGSGPIDPGLRIEDYPERFQAYLADGRTLLPVAEQPLVRALAGESTDLMTLVLRREGAQDRLTVWNARPLRDSAGEVFAAVATGRDVTTLTNVEAEAKRLRELSGDVFLEVDLRGRVLRANPAYHATLGRPAEDDAGRPLSELIHPEDVEARRAALARLAGGGTAAHEERWRRADGSWVWLSWNVVADPQRNVIYGVGRDVTDRRRQRQRLLNTMNELERSNRELEDFASVASHDLQEPLRKILAFGGRIVEAEQGRLSERSADYLRRMTGASARMQTLINDLLTFSRVRSRGGEPKPVDLAATVRGLLQDMDLRGGSVEVGDLPTLEADPTQMRQLFQNLIGNALKFAKPGEPPRVWVTGELEPGTPRAGDADASGPWAVLRVRDEGVGFEPQYAEKVFKIFQRLQGRHEAAGTGIGLAICRKIVARHGGTIKAESRPGEGATFTVRLPVHATVTPDEPGDGGTEV